MQQQSEGVDIRPRTGDIPLMLLGRHVCGRTHNSARLRQRLSLYRREAEIEQLNTVPGHHYVAGLEIPMRDALVMRGSQSIRDLCAELVHISWSERSPLQPCR